MAVADINRSILQLVLVDSIDPASGAPVFVRKSFSNVKANALPEDLYAVATTMAALQERELYSINRNDTSEITQV